jgi:hypothetical protein
LARELAFARGGGARAHGGAGFAVGLLGEIFHRHGGHFDVQVDTVEQRAGNFAAIARDLIGCAAAFAVGVAEVAARA